MSRFIEVIDMPSETKVLINIDYIVDIHDSVITMSNDNYYTTKEKYHDLKHLIADAEGRLS